MNMSVTNLRMKTWIKPKIWMTQSVPWISCKLTRSKPIKFITFHWSEFITKIHSGLVTLTLSNPPSLTINKDSQKKPLANPLCWLANPLCQTLLMTNYFSYTNMRYKSLLLHEVILQSKVFDEPCSKLRTLLSHFLVKYYLAQ